VKDQTVSVTIEANESNGELDRLSLMTLAAAKDFNDELTMIMNNADLSLDLVGGAHPASANLTELQNSAVRCSEITRCLLMLSLRARDSIHCARVGAGDAHSGYRDFV
jgi:hypothetical protein